MTTQLTYASVLTCKNCIHAFSGGLGSSFAISLLYPLDTVRVRLQVDECRHCKHPLAVVHEIYQEEGVAGLYKGWSALARNLFLTNFIYFYVFHGLKILLLEQGGSQDVFKDLMFGVLAGVITVFVTNPLWVVGMRMQLTGSKMKTARHRGLTQTNYSGMFDCMYKVAAHEGLSALWCGTSVSLILVTNPVINFALYEALKRYMVFFHQDFFGLIHFINGAISKVVATLLTYPLQVIQTRLRAGCDTQKDHTSTSILQCANALFRIDGLSGFYRGMESKLGQTVLTSAITLLSYEKIVTLVSAVVDIAL